MDMLNDDILDALQHHDNGETAEYELASTGTRFVNYIIDRVVLFVVAAGFTILLLALDDVTESKVFTGMLLRIDAGGIGQLYDYIYSAVFATLLYTGLEYLLKGKSVGKYFTKTRAVQLDNSPLTLRHALIRSLSRQVPFEPFSFLRQDPPRGWHDTWSKTKVIKDKGWKEPGQVYL